MQKRLLHLSVAIVYIYLSPEYPAAFMHYIIWIYWCTSDSKQLYRNIVTKEKKMYIGVIIKLQTVFSSNELITINR